jgi:archaellum biogenesis ATPase FlaH
MIQDPKRLILILGKGSTGKTLFCRSLYYALINANVNVLGFDADIEYPEFENHHAQSEHPIISLNFLEASKVKQFFVELDTRKPDTVIVDLSGVLGRALREQIDRSAFFALSRR